MPEYVNRIAGKCLDTLQYLLEHSGCEKCKLHYAKLYLDLLPIMPGIWYSENLSYQKSERIAKKQIEQFNISHYGMAVPPLEQTQDDFEKTVNEWKEQQAHQHG